MTGPTSNSEVRCHGTANHAGVSGVKGFQAASIPGRGHLKMWFDKPVLSLIEGLTTNGSALVSARSEPVEECNSI